MPVPEFTPFEGLLPSEGDPATFSPRAQALFEWFTATGAPQLAAMATEIAAALGEMSATLTQTNEASGAAQFARQGADSSKGIAVAARVAAEAARDISVAASENAQRVAGYVEQWDDGASGLVYEVGAFIYQAFEVGPAAVGTKNQATPTGYNGVLVPRSGVHIWIPGWGGQGSAGLWYRTDRPTMADLNAAIIALTDRIAALEAA
ncbi:hypothetical protein DL237_09915 [Pseudooceanicola sediminis]|uniref:Uncharacterized protein n=1 Tax=Pseudooceanicola sediminis TaxID=2211117 RepID=A0A399J166_9RHOB|nr:hypothetical protein [Pseudooceanicola sediminis]RII38984.1 hypothetical protein DL237_09915 [Pseudooceanicola sediminis]